MQDYLRRLGSVAAIALILLGSVGIYKFGKSNVAANQSVDWWPTFQHDASRTGYSTSPAPSNATLIWNADSSKIHYGSLSGAITCNGTVYATDTTFVVALNETDGSLMWRDDMTAYGTVDSTPSTNGTLLYIVSSGEKNGNGSLHALSCSDGHEVWNQKIGEWNGYWYSPAISQSYSLVLVSYQYHSNGPLTNSSLWAFSTDTGALVWRYEVGYGEFYTSAAIDDASKKVFIVNEDSNPVAALYSIDLATGKYLNATYFTYTGHTGTPTVYRGKVYVESGSGPYYLYCFDENLNFEWKTRLNGGFASLGGLAAAYGAIFTGGDCINASSGSIIWDNTGSSGYYPTTASPSVADGKVYWQDGGGFSCYNASTGKLIWNYAASLNYYGTPAISNGKAIFTTDRQGGLYVFGANIAAGADAWPMFHHDPRHTGYSTSTAPTTNQTLWSYTINGLVDDSPVVVDGVVYVGSQEGDFYALDAATGMPVWNYSMGEYHYVQSSPAVVDGVVYVGAANGGVYAFSAATGMLLWNLAGADIVASSPCVIDGVVYIGGRDGVYALDASNGTQLWRYPTTLEVDSSPAVVDGVVYVGSLDDNVLALNATTGALVWNYTTGNWVDSSPAVVEGVVYVGSWDGYVYALNASTGKLVWSYTIGGQYPTVYSSPAVGSGIVYLDSWGGYVYALNASTGKLVWNYAAEMNVQSSPAVAGGIVYLTLYSNEVCALNASTGTLVWSYFSSGFSGWTSPAVVDGVVYAILNGTVYAFGSPKRQTTCMVVKGLDSRIYYRIGNGTVWQGWNALPGSTLDSPAAAMLGNQLHIIVRGSDGYSLWHGYLANASDPSSFVGWTLLSGATSSAPTLASNGTVLCLVVRGLDNRIYYRCYNGSWANWCAVPTGATGNGPAAAMLGNDLHIVVQGMDGSGLWNTIVRCNGTVVRGWNLLSGATRSKPALAFSGGNHLQLVVEGMDNTIYYCSYTGITDSWGSWSIIPTGATIDGPGATVMGNMLCTVVRGMDGSTLWWGSINLDVNSFAGWTLLSGATPSAPTLTS